MAKMMKRPAMGKTKMGGSMGKKTKFKGDLQSKGLGKGLQGKK